MFLMFYIFVDIIIYLHIIYIILFFLSIKKWGIVHLYGRPLYIVVMG